MKKFYSKFSAILLLIILFISFVPTVSATTLADLKKGLADLKEEKRLNEENNAQVQAKIDEAKKELANIESTIKETANTITRTESEIVQLEKDIEKKEQEIKDLVAFLQLSNSENFYLKYIFGAESFTDLIYRISVIEQLSTKNDNLVDEMNDLIEENEAKIKELEKQKIELQELNTKVLAQIQKMGNQMNEYLEEGVDIDERIEAAKEQVDFYEKEGCKDYQEISSCIKSVPPDSSLIRPVKSGVVTDNYGWRAYVCDGCSRFHKGMDIGGNREGTPVLASASGVVVDIMQVGCGGKVLTINHQINGEKIATRYWHLYSINVKKGDVVVQGQQVATVGGGNTLYYDSCSTGPHLHYEVLQGHYNAYIYPSNVIDPRLKVNFPAYGVWW